MTTIFNFINTWVIPGAEGIFMGLGIFITFETVKGLICDAYKRYKLEKFQQDLIKVRDNKPN